MVFCFARTLQTDHWHRWTHGLLSILRAKDDVLLEQVPMVLTVPSVICMRNGNSLHIPVPLLQPSISCPALKPVPNAIKMCTSVYYDYRNCI